MENIVWENVRGILAAGLYKFQCFRVPRSLGKYTYSSRNARPSVEGASVMETKGTRGIRGICVHFAGRPREWRAISISQGKEVIRAHGQLFPKDPNSISILSSARDVCYIYRSPRRAAPRARREYLWCIRVTRGCITRSTSVHRRAPVPLRAFHISSGRCGRNDIFAEAPALTSPLKIFVFATPPRKWKSRVKSP